MSVYRTELFESAHSYLRANGLMQAAMDWQKGADKMMEDAKAEGWDTKGDWNDVWEDVLDLFAGDFHCDEPRIIIRSKQPGVPNVSGARATVNQCLDYLQLVENAEGWVDGQYFGHPGKVVCLK